MDVVDRETRRKVGVCALSLQVPAGMAAGVRAEDRLATLQRENALCEIHALDPAEAHVVLGLCAQPTRCVHGALMGGALRRVFGCGF